VQKIGSMFRDFLTPVIVLLMGGVIAYDHFAARGPSAPTPLVDGRALGRSFAPAAASALGDGWKAAADALEKGKSVGESQSALQDAWKDARIRAFSARVAPEFSRVLTEGAEPTDPVKRAEVVKLWRDFASGLKGEK